MINIIFKTSCPLAYTVRQCGSCIWVAMIHYVHTNMRTVSARLVSRRAACSSAACTSCSYFVKLLLYGIINKRTTCGVLFDFTWSLIYKNIWAPWSKYTYRKCIYYISVCTCSCMCVYVCVCVQGKQLN